MSLPDQANLRILLLGIGERSPRFRILRTAVTPPAAGGRTRLRPNRPLDAATWSRRPAPRAYALGAVYCDARRPPPQQACDGGLSACPGPASPPGTVQVHERRVSGARGETCLPLSLATLYVAFELSPVPQTGDRQRVPSVGMWPRCGLDHESGPPSDHGRGA